VAPRTSQRPKVRARPPRCAGHLRCRRALQSRTADVEAVDELSHPLGRAAGTALGRALDPDRDDGDDLDSPVSLQNHPDIPGRLVPRRRAPPLTSLLDGHCLNSPGFFERSRPVPNADDTDSTSPGKSYSIGRPARTSPAPSHCSEVDTASPFRTGSLSRAGLSIVEALGAV